MATATVARDALTEAEIREAIEAEIPAQTPERVGYWIDLPDEMYQALRLITDSDEARTPARWQKRPGWDNEFTPHDDHPGTLWADLRPSEAEELLDATEAMQHRALAAYVNACREGAIEVAIAFAKAHPDALRGAWPLLPVRELVSAG